MRFALIAWISGLLLIHLGSPGTAGAQGTAAGIVIYKERPSQGDEFADAALFKKTSQFAASSTFDIGGPNALVLENPRIAAIATFDDLLTRNLVDDTDRAMMAQKDTEIAALAARYPKAAPLLKPYQTALKVQLTNLSGGQVRLHGNWMPLASYQQMVKQQLQMAQDRDKQRLAEIEDRGNRERNLRARRPTLAGRFLVKNYAQFTDALSDGPASASAQAGVALVLPPAIATGGVPLPRIRGKEMAITEGHGLGSPAVLVLSEGGIVRSFRVAIAMRMEDDRVANAEDLRSAAAVLRTSMPDLAEALPLCVVSARTRLEFQRVSGGSKGEARVTREFGGHRCEIVVTEPEVFDDGSMNSILAVSVF